MWNPDLFLEKLYHQTFKTNSVSSYDEAWKLKLKAQLIQSLGEFSKPKTELKPIMLEGVVDKRDYYRMRVELNSLEPLRIPVYVLIPKVKKYDKLPAVLALHGHGLGSKTMVGLLPDDTENYSDPGIHHNLAIQLVRKGMIVAVPELIGFGDRKMISEQSNTEMDNSCYSIGSHLLLMGKTIAGLRAAECYRVLDYIVSLEEVDSSRIGCIGFSGGGLIAALTSIMDDRIKAAVICGYTNTFKDSIMSRRHCLDNYIPGILQIAEMPELIGLMAPKPLFIESGTDDPLFPAEGVWKALTTLKEIYRQFDSESYLSSDLFHGKHEVNGAKSLDWLASRICRLPDDNFGI